MDKNQQIRKTKLFLFDQDGTLYLGSRRYDFTIPMLDRIKATGRRYMFMTNNSSKSVEDYIKKLAGMGITATREDFITSSQATAYYLKKHFPGKTLYVCGTKSLVKELESEGFATTTELDKVDVVVMGFDTELTFKKLEDVSKLLLTRKDIPYIATNPDLVCPTEYGSVPDCGSVCIMINNATGRWPVVIGKPSPLMPELAMEHAGYSKDETAVVGDRIYTDIKSGLAAGITGMLVLSGETTLEILEASEEKPHLVLQDCSEILAALSEE